MAGSVLLSPVVSFRLLYPPLIVCSRHFLPSLQYVFPYVFVVAVRGRKAVYACKMGAKKGFGWGDTGDFGDRARAIAGLWIATRLRRLRERERLISCWRPPLTKFFGASTHVFQTESALCRVTTTVQQLSTGECFDQNVNCLTCIPTFHSHLYHYFVPITR